MEENERIAVLVDHAELDVRHVTELLDKSDKERKRLSERNAQLTINGMTLICFPLFCFGGKAGGGVEKRLSRSHKCGFCSVKRLRVLPLPPDGMVVHCRLLSSVLSGYPNSPGPIHTPGFILATYKINFKLKEP